MLFGSIMLLWVLCSVVQMIFAFIKKILNSFCLLNVPNDFLQTAKNRQDKNILKINGLQINIKIILSRRTAKIKKN